MSVASSAWLLALSLGMAACGRLAEGDDAGDAAVDAAVDAPPPPDVTALTVSRVAWNGPDAAVGTPAAVAQSGTTTVVFGSTGATVIAGAAVQANDRSITAWTTAGVIPAADTAADTWIVGVDAMGRVQRLRDGQTLEDVSDRYGVLDAPVRGLATTGRIVAFATDTVVALADGTHVDRYDVAFVSIAAGGGRIAGVTARGHVLVEDGMSGVWSDEIVPGTTRVALDSNGVLFAATHDTIAAAAPGERLHTVYRATSASIDALVASGARAWFASGGELGAIDMAAGTVARTHGTNLAATPTLVGSSSGDVWVISGGMLTRYTASMAAATVEQRWQQQVGPVFTRNCGGCHTGSTGEGHHDLSTYTAWHADRAQIYNRVFLHTPNTMPPTGTVPAADQTVLRAWSAPDAGM